MDIDSGIGLLCISGSHGGLEINVVRLAGWLTARGRRVVVFCLEGSYIATAAAGIPVTYRGLAASFTVVTGHRQFGEKPVDWRALAQVEGTIVVLMGVAERGTIAAELIDGGLAPNTPVAAIQFATTGRQLVARCRLDDLGQAAVESPATLVIGAVAALDVTEAIGANWTNSSNPDKYDHIGRVLC